MEKEIRRFNNTIKRANEQSRMVEGLAVVFNSESQDMGFYEIIDPNAIDQDTIANSDIFALLNHDENRGILARSRYGQGTLSLSLEADGLHYSFEAPKTALGDELLSYLSRGEITSSSFAFTIADGGDKWERDINGGLHRTITKIDRLFDVSPVFEPAYLATSANCRKFEEVQNTMKQLDEWRNKLTAL